MDDDVRLARRIQRDVTTRAATQQASGGADNLLSR
jgi:uridine kinase